LIFSHQYGALLLQMYYIIQPKAASLCSVCPGDGFLVVFIGIVFLRKKESHI